MSDSPTVRIDIDRDVCLGSGMCVTTAPALFALDELRQAVLVPGAVPTALLAVDGAQNCPVAAIAVYDPVTGERLDE
ncbi:MAG TPA: ferredoxin [Mycobacteriales bacterium]|nr:ferredoxin [Mycobacteriales bacterium]